MSETVWILMTVGAWIVVMGVISVIGDITKQADRAQRRVSRTVTTAGPVRTRRPFPLLEEPNPTRQRGW